MKYLLVLFLFSIMIPIQKVFSHEKLEIHELCVNSSDYYGCTQIQGLLSNHGLFNSNTILWRNYGPIKINWDQWRSKGNNHIVPSINSQGKPFFLAVNCHKKIINITGSQGIWRNWFEPAEAFEFRLVRDKCQ